MLLYSISCDTGVTWQSHDVILDNNITDVHISGLYTDMTDTASLTT